MPADARSLLRAAAAERAKASSGGIQDPFASYHPTTGALRCLACNYTPIKHESLWAAHASSKSHRLSAAKLRAQEEEEKERLEEEEKRKANEGKRKAEEETEASEEQQEGDAKRAKTNGATEEDAAVDPEWELFQRELAQAENGTKATSSGGPTFSEATIEVQPVLATEQEEANGAEENKEELETEAERRVRLDREEREEIYSRFEEEQRIQDEADERVSALKLKLERLKEARLARKQKKETGAS